MVINLLPTAHKVVRTSKMARQILSTCMWLMIAVLGVNTTALAREGVEVGKESMFTKLVPAEELERSAAQQYLQLQQQANAQNALAPANHPELQRLKRIAIDLIPHSYEWNARARDWKWEVVLIGSNQINAFCMPGGKIAFYTGILQQLKLTDDEVAMVMGHEIAHALREHARERMGKGAATQTATRIGGALLSGLLGIDSRITDFAAQQGAGLLTLKFGREDESESDLIGMELAARAGYDPRAGVTLWQKMGASSKGAPPQWLSTHPSSDTRIHDIEANLNRVMPLFERARSQRVRKQ